ncbi:MAG: sterol desaturase family protein [Alphaproteobacteria bacterium]|nr:sterol desaturase family protein [Alphaproteobacteria bacterium]
MIAWKAAVVALALVGLFVAERIWPAAPRPDPRWARVARNGGLWLLAAALSIGFVAPLTAWAVEARLDWRPDWWRGWPGLALDLIVLDGLIYGWHRANHTVPFLWRFHAVHHYDRFLDTTSALRFHVGEVALSATARAGVVWLFGFPLASILAFETLLLGATLFHHSNLWIPAGLESLMSRIVITPALHWVHHHRVQADTDSTYGTILSLWDPLFGTRSTTRRTPAMPIGVAGADERSFVGLLLAPAEPQPTRAARRG